jgi:hypothetical protein
VNSFNAAVSKGQFMNQQIKSETLQKVAVWSRLDVRLVISRRDVRHIISTRRTRLYKDH